MAQGARSYQRDLLKQLRAFCYAARLGSVTKAAERVLSSQPAVSLQIRSLEEHIGVALFDRNGPRIALTPAGRSLCERALPLVEGLDRLPDAFAEAFEGRVGTLNVGASETTASFLLPRYLTAFGESHDGIEVCVRVGSGTACLSWLRSHEVDIAFTAMDVEPPDLEFRVLLTSPYELITPPDHPLSALAHATPHDLGNHPMVAHTQGSYLRTYGEMCLRQHGVAPNIVVTVDGWEAIKACVEAGLGVALVPRLCLVDRDRVCRVPCEGALPPRRYGYVTRREHHLPLAVEKSFTEVLKSANAVSREISYCGANRSHSTATSRAATSDRNRCAPVAAHWGSIAATSIRLRRRYTEPSSSIHSKSSSPDSGTAISN